MLMPATLFFHSLPPITAAVLTGHVHLLANSNIRVPQMTSRSTQRHGNRINFVGFADGNGNSGGGQKVEVEEDVQKKPANGGQRLGKELGGRLFRWRDLLEPDPENILAVGLTGLLALASVQALWQLCLISIAILLGALKYSFIAALLLFIVITLL